MPYPDWNLLQEPDPLTAASLNTPLSAIAAAINALEPDALQERALRREHLPDVIPSPGATSVVIDGATAVDYDNLYPGFNTNDYRGTGGNLGGVGWAIISDGSTDLQITFGSGLGLNMSQADRIAGLMVLLNIELVYVEEASNNEDVYACFGIAWSNSAGGLTILPHTERFESAALADSDHRHIYRDVSIRTLLHADLLPSPTTEVYGIYALVAFHEGSSGTPSGQEVRLRRANMTVIPVHAADVL